MKIAFLGQGAMGSRMADRLAAAGFDVARWNRNGAVQTPREVVAGADVAIAMLRDDAAARAVWTGGDTGALAGLAAGAVAVDCSTLTVGCVRDVAAAAETAGIDFIDAPVLGSRPQAEAGQLIHLIGGEADIVARLTPVLAAMSAKQLHVGTVGQGAALKLIANTLFGVQVAAMAELIARMSVVGLDAASAVDLLAETPVLSPAARGAAGLMLAGKHDPMFPVELVAKDFGYAIGDAPDAMPMAGAARALFARAEAAGLGAQNLTAVATLY